MLATIADLPSNPAAAAELESWGPAVMLLGGLVLAVAVLASVGRRSRAELGRSPLLWPADGIEGISGIPGWAGVAMGLGAWSLLTAGVGFYLDVSWHVGRGRDEDLLTAPHTLIVLGLAGIALAGVLGVVTATLARTDVGFRFRNLTVPWSCLPLGLLGACALIGFPLDELWHRAYGVDVTMWSPTHLLMICGAIFSLVAGWLCLAEAGVEVRANAWTRLAYFVAAWLVLAGLTAVLGEFRFGVPQFQQLYHPVLLALTCAFAFTATRIVLGWGWSVLVAAAVVLPELLGVADFGSGGGVEFVPTRSPGLFIVSAVAVELAAMVVGTTRRLRFAVVAGLAVSTFGFAGEYAWSQGAAQPWRFALVRDAVLVGSMAAIGAAVLAVGYARAAGRPGDRPGGGPLGRGVVAAAAAAVVVALLLPLPRRAPGGVVAAIELRPVGDGTAAVEVALAPADAADDARWFQVMAWQGDGYDVAELDEVAPGRFVTEHPVPIVDRWKTVLRLHRGAELLAAPIYLPADPAIGAPEVPAEDRTVELGGETSMLLREVRDGPATTGAIAYTVIALVVAAWVGSFAIAVRRIAEAPEREVRGPTSRRSVARSTPSPTPSPRPV